MKSAAQSALKTWFVDETEEESMVEDHAYLWNHILDCLPQTDYSQLNVLDYGCNRGGFLQTLYKRSPFKSAVGVDVAQASLALARERNAALPIEFVAPDALSRFADTIDIAFSHEVIYLLPDLAAHANSITATLKQGGAYYVAIGCHTGNPLWSQWHTLISETTNLPVYSYSLDDYADAMWQAGLQVSMRPFALQDFVLIKPKNAYFPTAADSLHYHTTTKTIICAKKIG